ncbi:DUF3352 domain-containing protein [Stenomitos frigidus]|uniref:Metalloendopeptidase n=1 Tax=Stenomitos frigidus ULC18 TaxID=2107698 RepID=A0A2T1E2G8_9CYAN|nr:DUF3352 domain-containing protein [Stenomitos frigidus]PSB26814.1 metalloendopeptidase [Stenomitos frigidus ULC18]
MVGKKLLVPALAITAVAGGAIAYVHFNGASGDELSPQALAKVVPDDAYMTAFISMEPQNWAKLQKFGTPEAQAVVGKGFTDFQQKLLTDSKINYDADVKPWVGNVMLAVLPTDAAKPVKESNVLLVVGIKDKTKALSFAQKLQSESKTKAIESDYKGIKITDYPGAKSSSYTAVVKNYLVLAPEKKAVEQAIDTVKGEPSLASKAEFGALLSKGVEMPNTIARIYVPDYAGTVQQLIASQSKAAPLPAASLDQLKKVKSIVAGIGIDDAGIRMKTIANLDPQAKTLEYKPVAGSVVAQFPTETFAMLNGAGISRYWAETVEQSKSNPPMEQAIAQMRQSMQAANLDLDKDIFGWMDGDFSLSFITLNEGMLAQFGFGGVMVFDTSDRKTAEATLSKIDGLVKGNGFVQVADRDVQGKKITEWQSPQGVLVGHGWLDQDSVFVAIGEPLVNVMATKPAKALDSSDAYKTVMGGLPKQNVGSFYLDMDQTMSLVNRTMLVAQKSSIPPETAAVLNSIRGIGLASTQADKTTVQVEMLLALKPAK